MNEERLKPFTDAERSAIRDASPLAFSSTVRVDWGRAKGQGKRRGGMIQGAMADPPRGVKSYVDLFAKFPADDAGAKWADAHLCQEEALRYLRARAAGIDHERALDYALEGP